MDVNDYQGHNHLFDINLVYGAQPLDEVSRRIHMGSPLTHVAELLGEKARAQGAPPLFVPVKDRPLLVGEARPVRNARMESVSQVHKLFIFQHRINLHQGGLFPGGSTTAQYPDQEKSKDQGV